MAKQASVTTELGTPISIRMPNGSLGLTSPAKPRLATGVSRASWRSRRNDSAGVSLAFRATAAAACWDCWRRTKKKTAAQMITRITSQG